LLGKYFKIAVLIVGLAFCLSSGVFAANDGDNQFLKSMRLPSANPKVLGPDTVLFTVNGNPIPKYAFDYALRVAAASMGGHSGASINVNTEMKNKIFESLVDRELIYREGLKNIPADTDSRVDEQVALLRANYRDDHQFKADLKRDGITEENLREFYRRDIVVASYADSLGKDVTVSKGEIKEYFQSNLDQFAEPERLHLASIAILLSPDADEETRLKVEKKATSVADMARSGKDFAMLAKEHSEHAESAQNGGDMGFLETKKLLSAIQLALEGKAIGEVAGPISVETGCYVIKIIEKQEAGPGSLEKNSDKIEAFLANQKLSQIINGRIEELKSKAKIDQKVAHL
jgi:parvulin-like peptidyl-prolyl isomerase